MKGCLPVFGVHDMKLSSPVSMPSILDGCFGSSGIMAFCSNVTSILKCPWAKRISVLTYLPLHAGPVQINCFVPGRRIYPLPLMLRYLHIWFVKYAVAYRSLLYPGLLGNPVKADGFLWYVPTALK